MYIFILTIIFSGTLYSMEAPLSSIIARPLFKDSPLLDTIVSICTSQNDSIEVLKNIEKELEQKQSATLEGVNQLMKIDCFHIHVKNILQKMFFLTFLFSWLPFDRLVSLLNRSVLSRLRPLMATFIRLQYQLWYDWQSDYETKTSNGEYPLIHADTNQKISKPNLVENNETEIIIFLEQLDDKSTLRNDLMEHHAKNLDIELFSMQTSYAIAIKPRFGTYYCYQSSHKKDFSALLVIYPGGPQDPSLMQTIRAHISLHLYLINPQEGVKEELLRVIETDSFVRIFEQDYAFSPLLLFSSDDSLLLVSTGHGFLIAKIVDKKIAYIIREHNPISQYLLIGLQALFAQNIVFLVCRTYRQSEDETKKSSDLGTFIKKFIEFFEPRNRTEERKRKESMPATDSLMIIDAATGTELGVINHEIIFPLTDAHVPPDFQSFVAQKRTSFIIWQKKLDDFETFLGKIVTLCQLSDFQNQTSSLLSLLLKVSTTMNNLLKQINDVRKRAIKESIQASLNRKKLLSQITKGIIPFSFMHSQKKTDPEIPIQSQDTGPSHASARVYIALDGEGIHAYFIAKVLDCIEERTGKRISELADIISASSLSTLVALGHIASVDGETSLFKPKELSQWLNEKNHVFFEKPEFHSIKTQLRFLKSTFKQARLSDALTNISIPLIKVIAKNTEHQETIVPFNCDRDTAQRFRNKDYMLEQIASFVLAKKGDAHNVEKMCSPEVEHIYASTAYQNNSADYIFDHIIEHYPEPQSRKKIFLLYITGALATERQMRTHSKLNELLGSQYACIGLPTNFCMGSSSNITANHLEQYAEAALEACNGWTSFLRKLLEHKYNASAS